MIGIRKALKKSNLGLPYLKFARTITNIQAYDDYKEIRNFMDNEKPILAVLLFTSKWNPQSF